MYIVILSYSLRSFMAVEITMVLKRPNRTRNYVRHMVVVVGYVIVTCLTTPRATLVLGHSKKPPKIGKIAS